MRWKAVGRRQCVTGKQVIRQSMRTTAYAQSHTGEVFTDKLLAMTAAHLAIVETKISLLGRST